MRNLILPFLFVLAIITKSNAQQKSFDQPVQLRSCNITIDANYFIATTVMELEFYNPKDVEVEGFQAFKLNRGQVVTDFQLLLNGKYRDGSIEERWKANNAYNTIVGKRIDPAILQMTYDNNYSLRIYPIAARSSRKVKITITQLMKEDSLRINYDLPLNFGGITNQFNLSIKVNNSGAMPVTNKGLLNGQVFEPGNTATTFDWETNDIILNKPISFSIPLTPGKPQFCISKEEGITRFVMRFLPETPAYYATVPKNITVYWDASASAATRDLQKEIDFLEKYIEVNRISSVRILLFNHRLLHSIEYNTAEKNFSGVRNYLLNYKYSGATTLGNLDFSVPQSDAILLFSDGINSYGSSTPRTGTVQVTCIVSGPNYNQAHLNKIIGTSGGRIVLLKGANVKDAVAKMDKAENFLLRYNARGIQLNESFPAKLGKGIFLSGTMANPGYLYLFIGNNSVINKTETFYINDRNDCGADVFNKINMLKAYDSIVYRGNNWQNMVVFGLNEKVVTPQTAYLVLERIEDYIKYKIAPPKELEEQCRELNYVYKSEYKIKALNADAQKDRLAELADQYNQRIKWWDPSASLINLNKPLDVVLRAGSDERGENRSSAFIKSTLSVSSEPMSGNNTELQEVIVTGAFGSTRTQRSTSYSAQFLNTEQVNTIRQDNINNALAGKVAGLQVRSQSMAKLGAETFIRLRGENGLGAGGKALYVVDGSIMESANDVNPDDIQDYTILQGPAATALFGPDGSNGAIVMNSKKAKKGYTARNIWSSYDISSRDDVDYMNDLENLTVSELEERYDELVTQHEKEPGFYFDMAQYFFERGLKEKAKDILFSGAEYTQGNMSGLRVIAYILEGWKQFGEAIAIYENIIKDFPYNADVQRELAIALFQDKQYQAAINILNTVLNKSDDSYINAMNREMALTELNAIIAMHSESLDLSAINPYFIKALPVDLRITISGNASRYNYSENVTITEPGGAECSYIKPDTKNGGHFSTSLRNRYYYDESSFNNEYAVKTAAKGVYKVSMNAYNQYSYPTRIPDYVRVMVFRNFQKPNQTLEVQHVIMDNQYGKVTIAKIKW